MTASRRFVIRSPRRLAVVGTALALLALPAVAGAAGTGDDAKRLAAFQSARITLDQAIAAALAKAPGGAFDAGFELNETGSDYYVDIAQNADGPAPAVREMLVDPVTGAVRAGDPPNLDDTARAAIAALPQAHTTLASAAADAARELGGRASDASFYAQEGRLTYAVTLVKDDAAQTVTVDDDTGDVSSDED